MQELVREYLNDLGKKHRKRRRFRALSVVFALIVAGGVIWGLSRAGIATTGEPRCGREEHQHTDGCYSDVLSCGMEESSGHHHTEACYQTAEPVLVCGMGEDEGHAHTDACYQTAEPTRICGQEEYEGHTHTDACYTKQLTCGKEEHQHTDECYIDKSADVEDASVWNTQYENIEWENEWGKDLVTAAKLQLDYKESAANYTVAEDGSHKGYTRYGQFDGDPYTDWDASFVNFCMYYAGLKTSQMFPDEKNTADWYDKFIKDDEGKKKVYLALPGDYEPQEGDIIFLKKENEETEFQMGIVSSYNKEDKEKNEFKVIEGNSENQVKENTYKIDDEHIFEYIKIAEMEKAYKESQQPAAEPEEPEQPAEDTPVPEEATIELSTEVDGVTITLFGPESSFEAGKEYTIQAEKVEDEEVLATVEEAVEQMAEEKEKKVENFQPYDIKLLLDGEEVQPLGPVAVKFSGKEVAKSVENEETEVNVLHVDENTGEATDMEAVATDEKEVVIETEHFSVYVYVDLTKTNITGKIPIKIEHWGKQLTVVDGNAKAAVKSNPTVGKADTVYNTETRTITTTTVDREIYSSDIINVPSEYYADATELSKVCNVSEEKTVNYDVTEIWIAKTNEITEVESEDIEQNGKWEGKYIRYVLSENGDLVSKIKVDNDKETTIDIAKKDANQMEVTEASTIRFWYTPKEIKEDANITSARFYDYDISDGYLYSLPSTNSNKTKVSETNSGDAQKLWLRTDDQGVNAGIVGSGAKLGVGQNASGNTSTWRANQMNGDGTNLNQGNLKDSDQIPYVVKNVVSNRLWDENGEESEDGDLKFNVAAPPNLFKVTEGGNGSHEYMNYQLGFKQVGDMYTLKTVYKDGQPILENLNEIKSRYGKAPSYVYSNDFWPLDGEYNADPHMCNSENEYQFFNKTNKSYNKTSLSLSDDGEDHNWYFGMTYTTQFTVGDYTGPMEFYFRGDDDFWLYIDGRLAVDIGGIHASVGEKIDLREWMELEGLLADKEKTHTLKVFYMERGGFGSCCYMQYVLPNSEPVDPPTIPTTTYEVTKNWDDGDNQNPFRPKEIKVVLLKDGEETSEEIALTEANNWTHKWTGLPAQIKGSGDSIQYKYKIKEIDLPPGYTCYKVDENGNEILDEDGNKILDIDNILTEDPAGNETITGVLNNHLKYMSVDVSKAWENDDGLVEDYRPDSVWVQLYATDSKGEEIPYSDKDGPRKLELNKENGWHVTFEKLPEWCDYEWYQEPKKDAEDKPVYGDDGEPVNEWKCRATKIKYSVKEIDKDGKVVEDGDSMEGKDGAKYKVNYSNKVEIDDSTGNASLTVTNTLLTKFKILKKNSTGTINLENAVFTLTPYDSSSQPSISDSLGNADSLGGTDVILTADSQPTGKENAHFNTPAYTGTSNKEGIIEWSVGDENNVPLAEGEYIMRETKAPLGYALSTEEWIVSVGELGRASITRVNGTTSEKITPTHIDTSGSEVIFVFTFQDEALYELPSTGGSGIYWYMFSGVLLMAAASLITYRNKRREVLRS